MQGLEGASRTCFGRCYGEIITLWGLARSGLAAAQLLFAPLLPHTNLRFARPVQSAIPSSQAALDLIIRCEMVECACTAASLP
jgi:hypothetical protein